jgi:hypothetical protein
MQNPPNEREKLLEEISRLLSEAPDDASRRDLERLRDSLNSPQMLDMARELRNRRPKREASELMLNFHVPALPMPLTATACVITGAMCLYAASTAWSHPLLLIGGRIVNLWLVAVFMGALSVLFTALSFRRSFLVHIDTQGMASRTKGKRWRHLRVGAMRWKDIRSLQERPKDRVLEVHGAGGEVLDIPTKVVNYRVLRDHLDNMVLLYGDRPAT